MGPSNPPLIAFLTSWAWPLGLGVTLNCKTSTYSPQGLGTAGSGMPRSVGLRAEIN